MLTKEILNNLNTIHLRNTLQLELSAHMIGECSLKNLSDVTRAYAKDIKSHNERVSKMIKIFLEDYDFTKPKMASSERFIKSFANYDDLFEHVTSWKIFIKEVIAEAQMSIGKFTSLVSITEQKIHLSVEIKKIEDTIRQLKHSIEFVENIREKELLQIEN